MQENDAVCYATKVERLEESQVLESSYPWHKCRAVQDNKERGNSFLFNVLMLCVSTVPEIGQLPSAALHLQTAARLM